jgi:hypothetical protein
MIMYLSKKERTDIAAGKYPKEGQRVRCSHATKCKQKCGSKKIHKFDYEFCVYLHLPTKCFKDAKCVPI